MSASEELLRLDVEPSCNTADDEIIANLKASKEREWVSWLSVQPPKTKPLVICGSGPSAWEQLKFLPEEYDLMALNNAYNALCGYGLIPDYYVQLDAREFNLSFVAMPHKRTEFFLAAQVHPAIYTQLRGYSVTSYHLATETTQKVFGDLESVFLGCPAGTVGMGALGLAGVLGYRHLILIGYDSSYTEEKTHMVEQPQNIGTPMLRVEFDGRWYITNATMAKQVSEFLPWVNALRQTFPGMEVDIRGKGLLYDYVVTNQTIPPCNTTREEELARYPAIYAEDPEYKCTDIRLEGLKAALLLCRRGDKTQFHLDVSCGRGESLELSTKLGFNAYGTETVDSLLGERVSKGVLPHLPIADKMYDVVSLIEVIEHLVPEDVEPSLRELERIATNFIIISAATFPSWRNGANLHPSARTEKAWNELFVKIWGDKVKRLQFDIHPSPAWLVTL